MNKNKIRRKKRVIAKINSVSNRVQVLVHKSLKYIYIQINDKNGDTLKTFSSKKSKEKNTNDKINDIAKKTADYLNKNKITKITFNRKGYKYHGKVKLVADTLRKNKIQF